MSGRRSRPRRFWRWPKSRLNPDSFRAIVTRVAHLVAVDRAADCVGVCLGQQQARGEMAVFRRAFDPDPSQRRGRPGITPGSLLRLAMFREATSVAMYIEEATISASPVKSCAGRLHEHVVRRGVSHNRLVDVDESSLATVRDQIAPS